MATKEVMVSAPLIVLIYDRTFVSRGFRKALRIIDGVYWLSMAVHLGVWWDCLALGASIHHAAGPLGRISGSAYRWRFYAETQFEAVAPFIWVWRAWPHPLVFDLRGGSPWGEGAKGPWGNRSLFADPICRSRVALAAFDGRWLFPMAAPGPWQK